MILGWGNYITYLKCFSRIDRLAKTDRYTFANLLTHQIQRNGNLKLHLWLPKCGYHQLATVHINECSVATFHYWAFMQPNDFDVSKESSIVDWVHTEYSQPVPFCHFLRRRNTNGEWLGNGPITVILTSDHSALTSSDVPHKHPHLSPNPEERQRWITWCSLLTTW